MGDVLLNPPSVLSAAERWTEAAELASTASSLLGGESPYGMGSRVWPAATAFLSAWAGYATESAAIAAGYADALEGIVHDLASTDATNRERFEDLDSRLGPER